MDGLIDVNGKVVLPFEFDSLSSPTCGLVCCHREPDGKYGYLDLSGNVVIPFQFDLAVPFDQSSGTAWTLARNGGTEKYTLIDTAGCTVNGTAYDDIAYPREGRIRFKRGNLHGFLDESGAVVVPPRFEAATDFSSGLAAVRLRDDPDIYYYIDPSGNIRLGPYRGTVAYWSEFRNSLALLRDGRPFLQDHRGPTRYINPKGEVVLELPHPLRGDPYSDGFATVWDPDRNTCGYIDTRGQYLIPPSLTNAASFYKGYALVTAGEGSSTSTPAGTACRVRRATGLRRFLPPAHDCV